MIIRPSLAFTSASLTRIGRTNAPSSALLSSSVSADIPRPAVSVCVRCNLESETQPYYLLIQRGKEPNKGKWSFAGGSLEWGETAVEGALRELQEETIWDPLEWQKLKWYPGTMCTTDAIGEGFHYLIAHCFAELTVDDLPKLEAADDAIDVDWWTSERVHSESENVVTKVDSVIDRAELLFSNGLLQP